MLASLAKEVIWVIVGRAEHFWKLRKEGINYKTYLLGKLCPESIEWALHFMCKL
jgi:hypothetical protein